MYSHAVLAHFGAFFMFMLSFQVVLELWKYSFVYFVSFVLLKPGDTFAAVLVLDIFNGAWVVKPLAKYCSSWA